MRGLLCIFAVGLTLSVLASCGPPRHDSLGTVTPQDACVIDGEPMSCELFKQKGSNYYEVFCSDCHQSIGASEVQNCSLGDLDLAIATEEDMEDYKSLSADIRRAIVMALRVDSSLNH